MKRPLVPIPQCRHLRRLGRPRERVGISQGSMISETKKETQQGQRSVTSQSEPTDDADRELRKHFEVEDMWESDISQGFATSLEHTGALGLANHDALSWY